jgi:hypothetical protein
MGFQFLDKQVFVFVLSTQVTQPPKIPLRRLNTHTRTHARTHPELFPDACKQVARRARVKRVGAARQGAVLARRYRIDRARDPSVSSRPACPVTTPSRLLNNALSFLPRWVPMDAFPTFCRKKDQVWDSEGSASNSSSPLCLFAGSFRLQYFLVHRCSDRREAQAIISLLSS